MRKAFRVVAGLIVLGVVLQAAAVAGGWFGTINEVDSGSVVDENYEGNVGHIIHGIVGMTVMPLLGLVLFVLSFFTKVPGATKWAGLTLLAVVVQVVLAFIAFGVPVVGALHGINAFVLLGCAAMAARTVTREPVVAPAEARETRATV